MATVSRLKKGSRQAQPKTNQYAQKQQQGPDGTPALRSQTSQSSNMSYSQRRTRPYNANTHTKQAEKQYQSYYQISQSNPLGVSTSTSIFPHSAEMNDNFNVPLSFILSPMLALQNEHAQVMQKSADKIPRCGTCRAYMNCYNTFQKNKFTCFLCNRDSFVDKTYDPKQVPNQQWNSSIYQALGPSNFYNKQPSEEAFIFMIDISPEAAKMLYYTVAAMKEVLSRPDLDDLLIYFYTYDDLVHYYDFSGEEVKCTVVDQTIDVMNLAQGYDSNYLKDIRENLFILLDNLQEIAKSNQRKGYNFSKCFNYIFHGMKHLGGKFFIFQVNQSFGSEPMFMQNNLNPKPTQQNTNNTKTQSFFQSNNKQFFDRYTEEMLKNDCSMSFFGFESHCKNYKTLHDTLKLTSSQLKVYTKQCPIDLQRFYYDLSYLLGATYFKNVILEFVISAGWQLSGVYGNYHRIRQTISFQINSLQPSRKAVVIVNPSPNVQKLSPFCALQVITNYRYKRQSFISVATIVQPVSGFLEKLYEGIDSFVSITALAKKFMSILRMESITNVRRKMVEANTRIYQSALAFYKKYENLPDSIMSIFMASLAMLKSAHSHPELIDKTPIMDKVTGERNILQFSGPAQVTTKFSPYLFDLTNLDESMCREGADFAYPPTLQLKFQNVKDGLFLLDNGLSLTLFIAKHCDPNILQQVFGKPKLTKQDILNQQLLSQQNSPKVTQIQNLIKFLRQQKMYGWIPLYVVRCGENTLNERNFYLNFYPEKYEEFKVYKFSFEQFIAMVSSGRAF